MPSADISGADDVVSLTCRGTCGGIQVWLLAPFFRRINMQIAVTQIPFFAKKQNDKQQAKSADKKGSRPEMTDAQKTQMKQQQVKRQEYD